MLIEGTHGLEDATADICIVGSGPVGLSMAVECARKGLRTLLIEGGGVVPIPAIQQLSYAELVDPARHDDMRIAVARRLGGTSHLWGGRCLPFDPVDFTERPGVDAHWPISYADMAAYLPRAVAATGSGAAIYRAEAALFPMADGEIDADTLERWVNVQSSADVFGDDIRNNPNLEVRLLSTATGLTFAENGCVSHVQISHSLTGQKSLLPVRQLVLAGGGIETTRLLLAARRGAPDRFGGEDGPLGRYYMGHLYGEIADIIFASPQMAKAMDYHVDRHGSYVRRRFVVSERAQQEHSLLNCAFWPLVPPIADARHKSAILSLVYLALRNPRIGGRIVAEAIRRRHVSDHDGSILPHVANLLTGLPGAMMFAGDFMRKRYLSHNRLPGFFLLNKANRYGFSYHGEHAPNAQSRIWLSGEVDRLGVPRVTIDMRFSDEDARSIVKSHDLLETWLSSNRLGELHYRMAREKRHEAILASASHGTHQIGLARMGSSRRNGVVNGDLQTFDCPNLHVAGCAVLPTSGQANPTLTAVALGLRLADRFITGQNSYATKADIGAFAHAG